MRKVFLLTVLSVFSLSISSGQVKISEFLQTSKIAETTSNKLYFIDFWATWCVPCVTAKEYLGVLQKQFSKDFYIVSLSQENPALVERYLKRKPAKLAIALDYNGNTFKKHHIRSLPSGVLLNANGEVLWEGSATDLNASIISKYLRKETKRADLKTFFELISIQDEDIEEYIPKEKIEYKVLANSFDDLNVNDRSDYMRLQGDLKQIVSYLSQISRHQIEFDKGLNKNYEVYIQKPFDKTVAYDLISKMNLQVEEKTKTGEVLNLKSETPTFWDTEQINWGKNNKRYLIGDTQITADNVSLTEIAFHLSTVLNKPVMVPNTELSTSLHDWEIHYKYPNLMRMGLEDNYGIIAEEKTQEYPIYYINKKAPK